MKKILIVLFTMLFSFNYISAEEAPKQGFYFFGEEVPIRYYEYGKPIPAYEVNGYDVTARVYLDKWYNLNNTKTWNSVSVYNGFYEVTINHAAINPNTCSDFYIGIAVNKGTLTDAQFEFYNIEGELEGTKPLAFEMTYVNGCYFAWSEEFSYSSTITKIVVRFKMTSGTGSHTYEINGINIFPNDKCGPNGDSDYEDDEDVDTTPNDEVKDELNNAITDYDDLESTFIDNFNNTLSNLDTNIDILGNSDFMKTSQFISTQIQNIYDGNQYIRYMLTFGLILGIAFTIIGIRTKK